VLVAGVDIALVWTAPYVAIGFVIGAAVASTGSRQGVQAVTTANMPIVDRLQNATRAVRTPGKGKRDAAKRFLALALTYPTLVVAWPYLLAVGLKRTNLRPRALEAYPVLHPIALRLSATAAGFLALLFVTRDTLGPPHAVVAGAYLLLLALMMRHLRYATVQPLAGELRRGLRTPYVSFSVIAATDFLVLVGATILLRNWTTAGAFQSSWLTSVPQQLGSLRHTRELFVNRESTTLVLLGIAAALFFSRS
jgi:hypothetical protein